MLRSGGDQQQQRFSAKRLHSQTVHPSPSNINSFDNGSSVHSASSLQSSNCSSVKTFRQLPCNKHNTNKYSDTNHCSTLESKRKSVAVFQRDAIRTRQFNVKANSLTTNSSRVVKNEKRVPSVQFTVKTNFEKFKQDSIFDHNGDSNLINLNSTQQQQQPQQQSWKNTHQQFHTFL